MIIEKIWSIQQKKTKWGDRKIGMKKIKILFLSLLLFSLLYCVFKIYQIYKEEKDAEDIKEELI